MTEASWKRLLESYLFDMNMEYGNLPEKVKKFAPQKIPMMIEPFTLHCLRHTFCTMMYEAGVDVLVAQQQMGHSDVKTTLSIYTHLQREHQKNNISMLDEYITNNAMQNNLMFLKYICNSTSLLVSRIAYFFDLHLTCIKD